MFLLHKLLSVLVHIADPILLGLKLVGLVYVSLAYLQNEGLSALYIIQKGQVRITFDVDMLSSPNVCSLKSDNPKEEGDQLTGKELSVEKSEGSYFGEWALLGEQMGSLSAVAVGDVMCAVLTKEKFDSVVGPLTKLSQEVQKYVFVSCTECCILVFLFLLLGCVSFYISHQTSIFRFCM